MPDWLSIVPPLLAIAIAVWKKEVMLALTLGIWIAETLLLVKTGTIVMGDGLFAVPQAMGMGFVETVNRIVGVFASAGDARVLLFGLIIGALLELMRDSGGVSAFVRSLSNMGLTSSKRRVGILASLTGTALFMETSMSVLSSGVVARRLFDTFKMSRARLAFIIDSTSAPVCVLLPINAWGAYVLSLIADHGFDSPVSIVAGTIPYNFYAICILGLVWYTAVTTRVHGPLKRYEEEENQVGETKELEERQGKARYMAVPLVVLIAGMICFMFYTGEGNFLDGSGSMSVLCSVILATVSVLIMVVRDKVYTYKESVDVVYTGMGRLIPVTLIMLLSFAIGGSCKALGTGPFVASALGDFLPVFTVAPLIFLCGALISFTTGTSWGTFAIMVPLAIPLGQSMGLPPSLVLSAVLGGGVFGDHCSPISDTTLLSSLASGCDHLDHVRTQIPYAVLAGSVAVILYAVVSLF